MTTVEAQKYVSNKIRTIKRENPKMSNRQAVAIALAMARERGFKVPPLNAGTRMEKL